MRKIFSKVVAEKRPHGKGIVHHLLGAVLSGGCGLRLDTCSHEHTVIPIKGLGSILPYSVIDIIYKDKMLLDSCITSGNFIK